MGVHAPARCDNCGQLDDHPKLHYAPETYHHDCIPARVADDLDLTGRLGQVVDAAKGGTRGHELRAHIAALHSAKAAR